MSEKLTNTTESSYESHELTHQIISTLLNIDIEFNREIDQKYSNFYTYLKDSFNRSRSPATEKWMIRCLIDATTIFKEKAPEGVKNALKTFLEDKSNLT